MYGNEKNRSSLAAFGIELAITACGILYILAKVCELVRMI